MEKVSKTPSFVVMPSAQLSSRSLFLQRKLQNQLCHQMSTKRINDASNIFPRANIKQLSVRTRVCNRQELYVDRTPLRLEKKEKKN